MTLKEMREKNGLTLKDVSRSLGYKYAGGYHKIETGKQKLTLEQAKILSKQFNVELVFFFK